VAAEYHHEVPPRSIYPRRRRATSSSLHSRIVRTCGQHTRLFQTYAVIGAVVALPITAFLWAGFFRDVDSVASNKVGDSPEIAMSPTAIATEEEMGAQEALRDDLRSDGASAHSILQQVMRDLAKIVPTVAYLSFVLSSISVITMGYIVIANVSAIGQYHGVPIEDLTELRIAFIRIIGAFGVFVFLPGVFVAVRGNKAHHEFAPFRVCVCLQRHSTAPTWPKSWHTQSCPRRRRHTIGDRAMIAARPFSSFSGSSASAAERPRSAPSPTQPASTRLRLTSARSPASERCAPRRPVVDALQEITTPGKVRVIFISPKEIATSLRRSPV
jgi:hypothetical protein